MGSDDVWMRDVGPTFVTNQNGNVRGIDWGFNAWGDFDGGLYFSWDRDEKVAAAVMENQKIDRYKPGFILEDAPVLPWNGYPRPVIPKAEIICSARAREGDIRWYLEV